MDWGQVCNSSDKLLLIYLKIPTIVTTMAASVKLLWIINDINRKKFTNIESRPDYRPGSTRCTLGHKSRICLHYFRDRKILNWYTADDDPRRYQLFYWSLKREARLQSYDGILKQNLKYYEEVSNCTASTFSTALAPNPSTPVLMASILSATLSVHHSIFCFNVQDPQSSAWYFHPLRGIWIRVIPEVKYDDYFIHNEHLKY
jgi:hypothetical protein